jgi:RHS repeat-associated protein
VFDDDGNMTHGPAVNNPNSTGIGYQYDAHNRLTGVGGQSNLYRYNPEGHRVEASGIQYIIDPNAALSRTLIRVDGNTTTYYIWGANGLEYEITSNTTKTYHPDHLGSTMLLTNDSGQPTGDYYEYDSYGTPTYRTGTASTPFQWHGTLGVTTEGNGLIHMRARFYHPRIMRFINEDPIGFQGGMNLFAFVNGDPMSGVDPAGLCRYDWNSNTIAPTSLIQTNTPNNIGATLSNQNTYLFAVSGAGGYINSTASVSAANLPPYVAELVLYAVIPQKTLFGVGITSGHAWIKHTDYATGQVNTYPTWSDDSRAGNDNRNVPGSDLRINLEAKFYPGDSIRKDFLMLSHTTQITEMQNSRFQERINKSTPYYRYNTCAGWSVDTYEYTTGFNFSAREGVWPISGDSVRRLWYNMASKLEGE